LHREGPRVPNPACCRGSAIALYGAIGFIIGSIVLVALYRVLPLRAVARERLGVNPLLAGGEARRCISP
jgi:hypothetical protein